MAEQGVLPPGAKYIWALLGYWCRLVDIHLRAKLPPLCSATVTSMMISSFSSCRGCNNLFTFSVSVWRNFHFKR